MNLSGRDRDHGSTNGNPGMAACWLTAIRPSIVRQRYEELLSSAGDVSNGLLNMSTIQMHSSGYHDPAFQGSSDFGGSLGCRVRRPRTLRAAQEVFFVAAQALTCSFRRCSSREPLKALRFRKGPKGLAAVMAPMSCRAAFLTSADLSSKRP